MGSAGRDLATFFREGPSRASAIVWIAVGVFLVLGSRHLITREIPAVGQFAAFPSSPTDLVRQWVSGWSAAGLGSEAPNPTGFGVLGGLGYLSLGAMGLLRKALIHNAHAFILIHNHPSGDPTPSDADRRVTRRLREASETTGIVLQDHIIIGTPADARPLPYFSFREHGLL